MTTTVSRLALDVLASARVRREQYVGPWLPEPWVEDPAGDPADQVAMDEAIELALLILLERLSPAERASFVLHDVFSFTFEETAAIIGRSPATARQLATRARRRIADGRPRLPPTRTQQLEIVTAFARACTAGDIIGLTELLDPDVVWRTDGGDKVNASRKPQHGAEKVARGMLALSRDPPRAGRVAEINGLPGLVLRDADGILTVISLTVDAGRITAIDILRNPDKLRAVPDP